MTYSCNVDLWAENILMLCTYSTEFAPCQYSWRLKAFPVGVDWFPEGDGCCSPALFSTPWWREEWKKAVIRDRQPRITVPVFPNFKWVCKRMPWCAMVKLTTMVAIYSTNTFFVKEMHIKSPLTSEYGGIFPLFTHLREFFLATMCITKKPHTNKTDLAQQPQRPQHMWTTRCRQPNVK